MTIYLGLGIVLLGMGVVLLLALPLLVFTGFTPLALGDEIAQASHFIHYLLSCLGVGYIVWGRALLQPGAGMLKPTLLGMYCNIILQALALLFSATIAETIGLKGGWLKAILVLEIVVCILLAATLLRRQDKH